MINLFRELAKAFGKKLCYNYPAEVDQEVMDFCKEIKNLIKIT